MNHPTRSRRAACAAFVEGLESRVLLAAFYLSPSGSDAAAGTSPTSAWRTIDRVNQHTFGPGDQLLLERGATFTGSVRFDAYDNGLAGAPIRVGTWGTANFKETAGTVQFQAEAFTGQTPGTGTAEDATWKTVTDRRAQGATALEATPNHRVNTGELTTGPRRDYAIEFSASGTFHVWIRLKGSSGADDSVHAGLNGTPATLGAMGIGDGTGTWKWLDRVAGRRVTVNVATPGTHVFNLWMREDGVRVDAIVLTRDASYVPPGTGTGGGSSPNSATILSSDNHGIVIHNSDWFEVSDLVLVGSGRTNNQSEGIWAYNDLDGGVRLEHLHLDRVEARGYGRNGIAIGGYLGAGGFRDVRISRSLVTDNGINGLHLYGAAPGAIQDVLVRKVRAINNTGVAGAPWVSGSGILLQSVTRGVVERSVAAYNGFEGNGGIGIWTYYSNQVTIQFNESYKNRTSGPLDGGGFGLDGGTTNSLLQYNYSHDNHGAGIGLYQFGGSPLPWRYNTIRYNISENDGRRKFASLHAWSGNGPELGLERAQIYNNTFYMSPAASGAPSVIELSSPTTKFRFRNNIIVGTGDVPLVVDHAAQQHASLLIQRNNYWASGGDVKFVSNGTLHSSLSAWQSATGHERFLGENVGLTLDPRLNAPGGGWTVGDGTLSGMSAYRLRSGSAMIDQGLDIRSLSGQTPVRDFYNNAVPQAGNFDLGAHEWAA